MDDWGHFVEVAVYRVFLEAWPFAVSHVHVLPENSHEVPQTKLDELLGVPANIYCFCLVLLEIGYTLIQLISPVILAIVFPQDFPGMLVRLDIYGFIDIE